MTLMQSVYKIIVIALMVIVCQVSSQAGPPPHAKAWGKKYQNWKQMTPIERKVLKARKKSKYHSPPPYAKAWGRKYKNWKEMTPIERQILKAKEKIKAQSLLPPHAKKSYKKWKK